MKKKIFPILLLSFCLAAPANGSAQRQEKPILIGKSRFEQPLRVTSQNLETDNKKGVIFFSGNVMAKQGEMTVYADAARVFYDKKEEGNEVREIVATGNVRIQDGDRLATAGQAVFLNQEQKIILTGQPKVWQGKDMVSGEKITLLVEEDKSFVEGGPQQRVEVILHPKEEPRPKKGKP